MKVPTKEDYFAALNVTWVKMRQFLEQLVKTSMDLQFPREDIRKMGEIAAKIAVGSEDKDLSIVISELDAFVTEWGKFFTQYLGEKRIYLVITLEGESFIKMPSQN